MMQEHDWTPPGPGTWELDNTHQTAPFGRLFEDLYLDNYMKGFERAFASCGIPLRTIEIASVNGWLYMCARPLGGPDEPKGPPPKLLMSFFFSVVPQMRQRKVTASTLFCERPWAQREVFQLAHERLLARSQTLEGTCLSQLDLPQLERQFEQVTSLFEDIVLEHFTRAPQTGIPIGDFLVHTENWTGIKPIESIRALTGFSEATREPLMYLDRIIDGIKDLSILRRDDALCRIRGTPAAGALEVYLSQFGLRPAGGDSVFVPTLSERPELIVPMLRARAQINRKTAFEQARVLAQQAAENVRQQVPDIHRKGWEIMLGDAQHATQRREASIGMLGRATGLLRKTGLEIGRKLVRHGRLKELESVFDLTKAEILSLLKAEGPAPETIQAYTDLRRAQSKLQPPVRLGPPALPPPVDRMPPAVARVTRATLAFTNRFAADADPVRETGLAGHGVSVGVIEGTARVFATPEDINRVRPGEIVVARITSPVMNANLAVAGGVVSELGGLICHTAIVAREFGIPGVVGVSGLLDAVEDGDRIRVDGDKGTVVVVKRGAAPSIAPRETVDPAEGPTPNVPGQSGRIVILADASCPASFGGKASKLAELITGGVDVPPGLALDTRATEAIAAGDPCHLDALHCALERVQSVTGLWAIRSSGVAEDGVGASFAGQHVTRLGVQTESIADAISEVWASSQSDGVRRYRERLGLTDDSRMAVVVQPLLDANTSGVLFYGAECNSHVVEATYGLGETLVSGAVVPDRFTVDSGGELREKSIGQKAQALVVKRDGTRSIDVEDKLRNTSCIDEIQLSEVLDLGRRCAERLGGPQDIEWCFVGPTLYCLQSRPITRQLDPQPITVEPCGRPSCEGPGETMTAPRTAETS